MDQTNMFQSMISDRPTEYLRSYQPPDFDVSPKTVIKTKAKKEIKRNENYYIETLTQFKEHIPFDMFWDIDDKINWCNPWTMKIQDAHFVSPELAHRKEVIRTRPRLVISPALPIDDMTDPETRKIATDDTYISTWAKESRKTVRPVNNVIAPLSTSLYPPNLVALRQPKVSVVPPEWRMHSCHWEDKQVRSGIDKNDVFWERFVAKKDKM